MCMTNVCPAVLTLRTHLLALLGACLALLAPPAGAEPAPTSRLHWVTNGTVHAATVRDQTLFIGGSFTRVAPAPNFLGPWFGVSMTTGVALPPLPVTDAPVYAIEPDGAGGYFVGGWFTQIGGVPRTALAHVLPDGRIDSQFNPPFTAPRGEARPEVRSLARGDGVLYVGGRFVVHGAPTGSGLAAFDVGSGALRAWHPGVTVIADMIIHAGSRVFVLDQRSGPRVWSLDPITGATQWSQWLVNGFVHDAVLAGGRLVVVGPFIASPDARGLASLDPATGNVDPAWGPEWPMYPSPELNAITVVGSTVYVGGTFGEVGGQPRANAAAIDLNSGALTSWAPQVAGTVRDMVPGAGGSVYMAGAFRRVGGQPREALAQVDGAGAVTAWHADAYSTDLRTLTVAGDTLLAGGAAAVAGGVARENLAAFALDADDVLPWAPAMPHVVNDLASHGPLVFAGLAHQYPTVLPPGQASVVAFDADSGLPSAWTPPEGDPWDLLGLVDGLVYLFSSGFGSRFVRVDSQTGAVDPRWRVDACCRTPRVFPAGDLLYLIGDWFRVDGASRQYLAAVDRRTGALTGWNQRPLIAPPEGQRTVGGVAITGQSMYLDTSTPYGTQFLGIDLDTGLQITPFSLVLPGTVHDSGVLAAADGWLLVTRPTPASGNLEIRALRNDGVLSTWNPNLRQADRMDFSTLARVRTLTTDTDVIVINVTGGIGAPVHGVAVLPRRASSFPSALDATVRSNVVRLNWTGTEPPTASYVVEAGSEPGRADIASFRTGTSATSLGTLAGAGTYFVRIRADGPAEASPPSNEIAVAVAGCSAAGPAPPTRLAALINGTAVTLAWEPSADVALSYTIEAGSRDGAADLARITVPGDRTSFTTEAPPGTYFVRVRADTTCGPSGTTPDIWLTVGQGTLPSAPAGLTVTGVVPMYTASWQPVADAHYVLEVGSGPGLTDVARIVTAATTVGPAAVPPGATYYLRVRAIGAAGIGPPGQEVVLSAR